MRRLVARGQVQIGIQCCMRSGGGSHLLGVIVKDSDGLELRPDAAALREGCTAVLVRSLSEFISDGDISNGRWSRLYSHVSQKSRVEHEAPDGHEQTHQEHDQQEQQG